MTFATVPTSKLSVWSSGRNFRPPDQNLRGKNNKIRWKEAGFPTLLLSGGCNVIGQVFQGVVRASHQLLLENMTFGKICKFKVSKFQIRKFHITVRRNCKVPKFQSFRRSIDKFQSFKMSIRKL